MARRVRVVLTDSGACLGETTGRAAAVIALLLVHADRLNAPGVRKVVVNDTPAGLRLLLAYRPHAETG